MNHVVSIGDLFKIQKGKKAQEINLGSKEEKARYIQIEDLRTDNKIKYCRLTDKNVVCESNDILIAWDGANAGTVGYGLEGVIGSTIAKLHTDHEDVFIPYIGRFLQSKFRYLRDRATGATIPHIQKSVLLNLKVPLPPLDQQKRIASILNQAQSLIDKRREAMGKLDELCRSVFINTVGPQSTDYHQWNRVKLAELALNKKGSMRTGPFGSDLKHSEFTNSGICVLGIDNAVQNRFCWGERRYISKEKYEHLKKYTVYPGDIIITIMGTTGRSAVVPDNIPLSITSKHLATLTLDKTKALPEFISYSIHSHPFILAQIKRANKGAIMNGLNLTIIKELEIILPPLHVQQSFLKYQHKIEHQLRNMQQQLDQLQTQFDALLQRAFTGQLDFSHPEVTSC